MVIGHRTRVSTVLLICHCAAINAIETIFDLLSNAFAIGVQFTPFWTLAPARILIEHLVLQALRPARTLTTALVIVEPLWGRATSGYATITATEWDGNRSCQSV